MILDTNGLPAMADGDPGVAPILRHAAEIALPVIALGEYRYGIRQSRHRARYERWLNQVLANCRVLSVDETTSAVYADIRGELKRAGRYGLGVIRPFGGPNVARAFRHRARRTRQKNSKVGLQAW